MSKGFTFQQLAVILLVILGLVVAVVLAATQLAQSGSQFAQIGGQAGSGAQGAADAAAGMGIDCFAEGGFCIAKYRENNRRTQKNNIFLFINIS